MDRASAREEERNLVPSAWLTGISALLFMGPAAFLAQQAAWWNSARLALGYLLLVGAACAVLATLRFRPWFRRRADRTRRAAAVAAILGAVLLVWALFDLPASKPLLVAALDVSAAGGTGLGLLGLTRVVGSSRVLRVSVYSSFAAVAIARASTLLEMDSAAPVWVDAVGVTLFVASILVVALAYVRLLKRGRC
jgi:hypothetical protein